jgi:hypothetical protein
LAVILGVSVTLTAGADAQPAAPMMTVPAPAKSVPRQTPAPAVAPPPRTPDPELDLPDTDTAKRVTGLGDEAVGGADCRTQCHTAYYMCLSADDSGGCPTAWTQCLNACPAHSSNF